MKIYFAILALLVSAVSLFTGCAGVDDVGFENTVQQAKDKVFPAVV